MPASSPSLSALIPHLPPVWAEVFGEDDCGIFAECEVKGVRFVWRWICPGKFQMGSPEDENGRWSAEGPQHEVILTRGYWLGETPVTQAQWQAVMGSNPSRFPGHQRPVERVSWHDSVSFIQNLNVLLPCLNSTLPTEAQWEYACRAGSQAAYNDGSPCPKLFSKNPALDKLGWFDDNSNGETHEVKRKDANAWGLYDMHGNVWEWCRDAWDEDVYAKRSNGIINPETVSNYGSTFRVVRGGSWGNLGENCRAAVRNKDHSMDRWDYLGLRLSAGQGLTEKEGSDLP